MHKLISFLTLVSLLFTKAQVFAQDDTPDVEEEESVMLPPPRKPLNSAEVRNWIFAGGSLLAATLAIVFVACNPGSKPPLDEQALP